ncbi:MAG: hypothetical protein A2086_00765 [Spirochaetes bacterium GWD1_27_9]|nr:MAG: hypothetical protein A2086_00765 [Spirochaetes bacterium GWD1_27_9]
MVKNRYFSSISFSILRLAFILVLLGLFLPIGCDSNGFQVSQGIMGKAKFGNSAVFLTNVDDIYAYFLLGSFALALIGLIVSFVNTNFFVPFAFLAVSFLLVFLILIEFKIFFSFSDFSFYMKILFTKKKIAFEIGAYSMLVGYLGGAGALVLKILKIIN